MSEARHKIAFAGFRHGHIFDLYSLACASPALEVVAACEEHAETRAEIRAKDTAAITHDRIEQMLDEVDCDIVATGTYFADRGPVLIEALSHGKHVISGQASMYSDGRPRPHCGAGVREKPQGRLHVDHARCRLRLLACAT